MEHFFLDSSSDTTHTARLWLTILFDFNRGRTNYTFSTLEKRTSMGIRLCVNDRVWAFGDGLSGEL